MSLQVWLPLNGSLENKGLSDLTFQLVNYNNAITSATSGGKVVSGLYKRTTKETADYIISNKSITLDGDVTMCCWAKVTGVGYAGSANGIFGQHGHFTGGLGITMKDVSSTDLRMSVNTGLYGDSGTSDRTFCTYYGSTNIYNAWHHLCLTYNSSTKQLRMYVDGNLETITGYGNYITLAGNSTVARPIILFAWSTDYLQSSDYRPPCELNDVRVYDHCLSPREVKLLAQGLVTHYKLDEVAKNIDVAKDSMRTHTLSAINGATSLTWGNYFGYDCFKLDINVGTLPNWHGCYMSCVPQHLGAVEGDIVTRSCKIYVPSGQSQPSHFCELHEQGGTRISVTNYDWTQCDTWQTVSQTAQVGVNSSGYPTNLLHYFYAASAGDPGVQLTCYIRDFQLEINDHVSYYTPFSSNIISDYSGYNNHGTGQGSWGATSDTPRYTRSISLNNNRYINASRSHNAANVTIACWVKIDEYPESNAVVFADQLSKIAFGFWNGAHAIIACGGSSDSARTITNLKDKWALGTWHHIAITKANTTYTFYLDGEEWSTLEGVYGSNNYWTHTAANELLLGGRRNGSAVEWPFTGSISDFRTYATTLNEADIKLMYQSATSFLNNGVMYTSEFIEHEHNLKFSKTGTTKTNSFTELSQLNRMKIKTLPDASTWARIHWLDVTDDETYFAQRWSEVQKCINQTNRFSLMQYVDLFTCSTVNIRNLLPAMNGRRGFNNGTSSTKHTKYSPRTLMLTKVAGAPETVAESTTAYPLINGHKYYARFEVYTENTANAGAEFFWPVIAGHSFASWSLQANQWNMISSHFTKTYNNGNYTFRLDYNYTNTDTIYDMWFDGVMLIDLTAAFGAGQEPDKAWCDANIPYFTKDLDIVAHKPHYEFMITHPKISETGYNRWIQTSSPNKEGSVEGLQYIGTQSWSPYNGGIRKYSVDSLTAYHCSGDSGWYTPIGQYQPWTETQRIPAANGDPTTEIELWVRIDNTTTLPLLNTTSSASMFEDAFTAHQLYEL